MAEQSFFEQCIEQSKKRIAGEYDARKVITLIALGGRLTLNHKAESSNLIVHSFSGTGKDWVVRNTLLSFLPKKEVTHRTRISKTTLTYWHAGEENFTWNGKILYLEDTNNNVLNCEVMKTMSSGGSKATITQKINGSLTAKDILVKGKPVIIHTIAKLNLAEETIRRFPILILDDSVDQTKAVVEKQFDLVDNEISFDEDFINEVMSLQNVKVIIPYTSILKKEFVKDKYVKNLILRTHLHRITDYIKFSASINQLNRDNDGENIIANGEDFDNMRDVMKILFSNVNFLPVTKEQRKLLDLIVDLDKEGDGVKTSKIVSNVSFRSRQWVYMNLNVLVDKKFLYVDVRDVEYSNRPVSFYSFKPVANLELPYFHELKGSGKYL